MLDYCRRQSWPRRLLSPRPFLAILCLWFLLMHIPGWALGAELGPPPIFPQDLSGLELPAEERGLFAPEVLQVNPQNRQESRTFFNTYYLAATPPINWTGNRATCNAGTTAENFKDAVFRRVNYYRAMAGVPAGVVLSDTYSAKDQQAALMMSVNGTLNHTPPSSWSCYTADGAEAAGKSNLAMSTYNNGPELINLYLKDPGDANSAAGHRRWVLYPQTQNMGTGDLPPSGGWAVNALWIMDANIWGPRPPTREEYVAWPPPGYVPYQVVYPRWSFAFAGANFSGAAVTMKLKSNGVAIPAVKETLAPNFGENALVWRANGLSSDAVWPKPAADTAYEVTVTNVVISGSPRNFTYLVTVFDPATSKGAMPPLPLLLD
jgi:uncharacterized protein YkwD